MSALYLIDFPEIAYRINTCFGLHLGLDLASLVISPSTSGPNGSPTLHRVLADSSRAKCSGRVGQDSVKSRRHESEQ